MMEDKYSDDWWRWQLYRGVANLMHEPNDVTEAHLIRAIKEYRRHLASENHLDRPVRDEHELVMNFR